MSIARFTQPAEEASTTGRSAPLRPDEYARLLSRRRTRRSTPFDPDWLYQRKHAAAVSRALARCSAGRIVDIGCGGRPFEGVVPRGARYFGLDTPASAGCEPDAWALATCLPVADSSVDTVLCTQVLEHLADPASATREMARVLRPGGTLVLTAPQAWFLHEEPFDFYRFTRFGLLHLCHEAGLVPAHVESFGGFWAMLGVFAPVHVGSYIRWGAERGTPRAVAPGRQPLWRKLVWPLRLPMAVVNIALAALEAIPHPGIFALGHLVVAEKPGTSPFRREDREA